MSDKNNKNILYCSFCGKSQHEVRKLIAGPTVFICDECVELCMDIIKEENKSSLVKHQDGVPSPKEICNVLDEYVIGQKYITIDEAINNFLEKTRLRRYFAITLNKEIIKLLLKVLPIQATNWDKFSIRKYHFNHKPITNPETFGLKSYAKSLKDILRLAKLSRCNIN